MGSRRDVGKADPGRGELPPRHFRQGFKRAGAFVSCLAFLRGSGSRVERERGMENTFSAELMSVTVHEWKKPGCSFGWNRRWKGEKLFCNLEIPRYELLHGNTDAVNVKRRAKNVVTCHPFLNKLSIPSRNIGTLSPSSDFVPLRQTTRKSKETQRVIRILEDVSIIVSLPL